MSILDKLLGLTLIEDLTETAWWTEVVFRELEQGYPDERMIDAGGAAASTESPDDLT